MSKLRVIGLTVLGLIVLAVIFSTFLFAPKEQKEEPFGYLETKAHTETRKQCRQDYNENACVNLLIFNVYGHLNGESDTPDGYVFTFSNTFKPEKNTIVYQTVIMKDGEIDSIERMDKSILESTPVE